MTSPPTFDTLPINVLFPHPANVRRELRDIDELADSIRTEGLHQPLVVAPRVDGDDGWTVIMGHRRLAATRAAGMIHAPCLIRTDLDTEEKVLSAMLAENCSRNDLTVSEEGEAFQRLLDLDLSAASIGKRAGRSRKQVADRVTVAAQPERVRRAVDDKQLTIANALALADLEDDHQLYARVEQSIGTPQFDYEIKRAIALRANLKAEADLRVELAAAGYVELTEKERSALHSTVDGFRLEQLWRFEPEGPEESLRYSIWFPSPEYQPPHVRWYRLVQVKPTRLSDETPEVDSPSAAETAEERAAREAAEVRAAAAEVEAQERRTAANQRRAFLRGLWERDFTDLSLHRTIELHRIAVTASGYMEPLYELAPIFEPDVSEMDQDDPRLDPSDWGLARLQFVTWWCRVGCVCEHEVSNLHPNNWDEDTHTYLETLRDHLGYELSDIEEALLDTYNALTDGDGDD